MRIGLVCLSLLAVVSAPVVAFAADAPEDYGYRGEERSYYEPREPEPVERRVVQRREYIEEEPYEERVIVRRPRPAYVEVLPPRPRFYAPPVYVGFGPGYYGRPHRWGGPGWHRRHW